MAQSELAVNKILRCSKCGFAVVPDAIKCPRCNAVYYSNGRLQLDANTKPYQLKAKDTKLNVQALVARYRLTCPHHGRIDIKATVTSPSVKCPFC
jgi:hypothetical protein